MRPTRAYGLVGLAAFAVVAAAVAQTQVIPAPDKAPVQVAPLAAAVPEHATWGDPNSGQAKAGACAACHGLDGNPAVVTYPRLAGMPERYVAQQLGLFKAQERNTGMASVMYPIAAALSAQDMRDLGAWFQTQKAGAGIADDTAITTGANSGKKYFEVGQQLFRGGDKARGIPACMACHGPAGQGNPGPAYPALAGQQAEYAKRRLEEYRAGTGQPASDKNAQIMVTIAKGLTDEEIGSLASYLQGLHVHANDVGAKVATAAAPAMAPAAPVTGTVPAAPPTPAPAPAATPSSAAPTKAAAVAAAPKQG